MDKLLNTKRGKENDDADKNKVLKARLDRYWTGAQASRKELDWQWFQYDLWVSGNHFAKWDKNTQQIISSPRVTGSQRIAVNKIYTTLRGVRSWVLQNQPKADVTPYNYTDESIDVVAQLNQYLGYLHDRLRLRYQLRASMWHALKYSVGYWQVLWDQEKQEIIVNVVDPYDLYWDPTARTEAEARFVILCVRRNIEDMKDDPMYKDVKWDEIAADNNLASSPLKARIMQHDRGAASPSGDKKGDGTVIVKEYWYKESVDEEVEEESEGEVKKSKVRKQKIMLCTRIGDKIVRGPDDTGLDRLPFFTLHSDIEPLSLYGTGWVKNLVPINRLLDRLESSAAEYNDLVNKGRFIADKGHGVRIISNEHGQVIEKKAGKEVTAVPVPPLSAQLDMQIQRANRYIEDIGSLHDASLGRVPSGAKSGVAIEALQEGDSNTLSELSENTELFLENVYEYILSLAAQKYQFAKQIVTTTTTGEKQVMTVIGEDAGSKPEGALVIPKKIIVDVKISSWLAYTAEGRRMAVKDLVTLIPNMPPEFILEAYQTGNIADIVKKIKEQGAKKLEEEKAMAEQQAQVQAQAGQQQIDQQAQAQLNTGAGKEGAIAVIRAVVNGQRPQLPSAVNPDFVDYLASFIEEGQADGSLAGDDLSVLIQYLDQASSMVRGGETAVN